MASIPLPSSIAAHLTQYGLSANKRLGQHFLLDRNITDKMVRVAGNSSSNGDWAGLHVLEIGPGPAALTRSLLDTTNVAHVTAVEMDRRFSGLLHDVQTAYTPERLTVCMGCDGLTLDPTTLQGPQHDNPVRRIVSNLPYNVGTKMFVNWLTAPFWDRLVLMFQREVADRIVAAPGTPAYGRLSVLAQSVAYPPTLAMTVPARAFTPSPKVDSAVVVLNALPHRFHDLDGLSRVTQAAFGQRRKMVRQSLKLLAHSAGKEDVNRWLLEDCGVDPTSRAETLSVQQYQQLTTQLASASRDLPPPLT